MLLQSPIWTLALIVPSVLALPPIVERSILPAALADIVTKSPPGPEVEWGQFFTYHYGFCRLSAGWEMFEPKTQSGCVPVSNKNSLGYMRGGGDYKCEILTWSGNDCRGDSKSHTPVEDDITCFSRTPFASFQWNCTSG